MMYTSKVVPEADVGSLEASKEESEGSGDSGRWAELPELAMELVLQSLLNVTTSWTERKAFYSAAGVCSRWRAVALREVVQNLWETDLPFIHPRQLLQTRPNPLPGGQVKCCLRRELVSRGLISKKYVYTLFLEDPNSPTISAPGKFLLSAVQQSWQCLSIYTSRQFGGQPFAKVLCNTWGNQYKLQRSKGSVFKGVSKQGDSSGSSSEGNVLYRIKWKNLAKMRQWDLFMHIQLPAEGNKKPIHLANNPPRWNQGLKCFSLDFHGRVKLPSVKNFQLLHRHDDHQDIVMQFGKIASDMFILDFDPTVLSAFQAFGIALASFEAT